MKIKLFLFAIILLGGSIYAQETQGDNASRYKFAVLNHCILQQSDSQSLERGGPKMKIKTMI